MSVTLVSTSARPLLYCVFQLPSPDIFEPLQPCHTASVTWTAEHSEAKASQLDTGGDKSLWAECGWGSSVIPGSIISPHPVFPPFCKLGILAWHGLFFQSPCGLICWIIHFFSKSLFLWAPQHQGLNILHSPHYQKAPSLVIWPLLAPFISLSSRPACPCYLISLDPLTHHLPVGKMALSQHRSCACQWSMWLLNVKIQQFCRILYFLTPL